MKKRRILIIIAIIISIIAFGGKAHMDKQDEIRQARNLAVKELQEQVSQYIIENYVGIEQIEWHGWEVVQPTHGIYTGMTINYYSESNQNVYFSYDVGALSKAIERTDRHFLPLSDYEKYGSIGVMRKTLIDQGVAKSKEGSSDAVVIYDWEEIK